MKDLLIIIPLYNEEKIISQCYNSIMTVTKNSTVLFVDDGSIDKSLSAIKELSKNHNNILYSSFSKNFGKESAIFCGLEKTLKLDYKYFCIMDSDGQDPPSLLNKMYDLISNNNNFDAVACRRINRKGENVIRSFLSTMFYKLINKIARANIPEGARDYIMMKANFRDAILMHKEKCRFFKGLYTSIGFNIKWIEFENIHIKDRESKWSLISLIAYAFEGIISSSEVLLLISAITGIFLFIISFIFLLLIIIRKLIFGDPVAGWTSLVCIILFLFGIQFIFMGIIGLYISKNYKEVKDRPIYIEKENNIN